SPSAAKWSSEQDKLFEKALAGWEDKCDDPEGVAGSRWEAVAALVPGKTAADVRAHYELLLRDISSIEAGLIALPCYSPRDALLVKDSSLALDKKLGLPSSSCSSPDQERRKGIPWTEDEHRLFLLGLEKFGKGDWRSISRNFVVSRTPTQVASHAQKYFIRLNSIHKDKRRTSIHDITSVN
ncbi:hypothetical protein SELMODRAFT_47768, partial [Selaginella moellendorffii]